MDEAPQLRRFQVKIAHVQTVSLSNDISEVTPLPLRILELSSASTNDGHSLRR